MKYIIVSDIFGVTPQLMQLANLLAKDAEICDPYLGELQAVQDEHTQYQHFLAACGHDVYFCRLCGVLSRQTQPITILAFSAGASAAWRAQASLKQSNLVKLIAFYPSQIRYHLDLAARLPCEFIFANDEPQFDIDPVISLLNKKQQVRCHKAQYGHGFMNALSKHFDAQAHQMFTEKLVAESKVLQSEKPISITL